MALATPTTTSARTVTHREGPGWRRKIQFALVLGDGLAIVLALTAAVIVRFGSDSADSLRGVGYPVVAVLIGFAWFIGLYLSQCYNTDYLGVGYDEFRRVLRATFQVFGALAIAAVALRLPIARGFLAIAFPLGLALLELSRLTARRLLHRRRQRGRLCDRVVLLGSRAEVRYVADMMQRTPEAGYVVSAVATGDEGETFELGNGVVLPQLGSVVPSMADLGRAGISAIVVAGQSKMPRTQLRQISWQLEGSSLRLAIASSMTDVAGPRIHWRPVEGLPLMSVETPTYSGTKYTVKRLFDIVVSTALIVLLSPVLIGAALAVRFSDRGPVFFRQTRVGVNGSLFKMTKFRSMIVGADAMVDELLPSSDGNGMMFKMRDDPRVTKVGAFLRRYSIDELPQLFDVFAGTMSLVGPRPPLPTEVDSYEKHVHRRLNVKPGMTGPWQVGGRSNLSWEESVRKDLYYVENWSLTGDLIILFKTVRAVLERDGAY